MKTALIVGATGLIGGLCLPLLLAEERYERVVVLTRSPLALDHPKLSAHVVDFDRPESYQDFAKADDVFSCVGTTRAKTPSREDYRKIDFGIPVAVAKYTLERGARRVLLVSSVGADPKSRLFYPRLKGEVEEAVSKLPFEAAHIFRPSLLLGRRNDSRPGEGAMIRLSPLYSWLFAGPFRKSHPIQAEEVARAMVRAAQSDARGIHIHEYDSILRLAAS
jgi:uncharacterized protein YbjT (DUF2867 family)